MLGIIMEALIAELVLSAKEKPTLVLMMIGGIFGSFWVLIQPFISGPLLLGRSFLVVWLGILDTTRNLFNLPEGSIFSVLALYILIHILFGLMTGYAAWKIGKQVNIRLWNQKGKVVHF